MAASFNIGDRVIAVSGIRSGLTGTIVDFLTSGRAGVSFDDLRAGHDCNGTCENGHGWYVNTSALELISEVSELQTDGIGGIVLYNLDYLSQNRVAVKCNTRAEARLLFQIARRVYDCDDWSDEFDYGNCCYTFEDGEADADTERYYISAGYTIIPFREFFISLCEGGFDLDLFARHNVAIQVDTVEQDTFLIEQYNLSIVGRPLWKRRTSPQAGYHPTEPTCYSFGHMDETMGFCNVGYYLREGYVVFHVEELFDTNTDFAKDDPTVDFLLR